MAVRRLDPFGTVIGTRPNAKPPTLEVLAVLFVAIRYQRNDNRFFLNP